MKIGLAQLNYTIGDFEGNKLQIINRINEAKAHNIDLIVFAEQAICGTPAYDLLNKITFLELCEETLVEVASYCDNIAVIIGLPIACDNNTISVAALIQNRQVIRYVGKKDIISRDEKSHISPSKGCEYVIIGGHKVAIVVGEDIRSEVEFGQYADTIVNIAADPYSRGIIEDRYSFFRTLSYKTGKNIVFVNQIGGQTDVIYDGSSAAFNTKGECIAILNSFEEDFASVDLGVDMPHVELPYQNKTVNVYKAMKLGLGDYFHKNGFKKACLGLSGGIDSALVLAIAAEVVDPKDIKTLLMPSPFSSDHSVDDALKMAQSLGVDYGVIPISEIYTTAVDTMKPVLGGTPFDVTEENMQSRIRCMLMMAVSNKYGHILLNTSNKSEVAVGYGTLYGDWSGGISITADLYKTEIYDLARYINRDREIIPEEIIVKAPSAELHPGQVDTDTLPAYDVLDAILYRMIEKGEHREEIINAGFDADVVNRIHAMVVRNEYKRYQSCPVLRLSTCTFGIGRILPLTNKYGY